MKSTKQDWIEGAMWVGIVAATIMSILVFASLGCSDVERVKLTREAVQALVQQGVVEMKATFGVSILELQNQFRELLWETFYKITGVGAGGTAAIVGHRYTGGYKNIQKKAVNGAKS